MATYYDAPRIFNVQSITVNEGQTSATGTHGLGATPNAILLNPLDVYGAAAYAQVSEASSTEYTIRLKDAQGADAAFKVVLT